MWPRAALLLSALALPACFDLQKVDPGAFVIDDFEDADLTPRANAQFGPWTCRPFTSAEQGTGPDAGMDGGQDAGADGGQLVGADGGQSPDANAGQVVNCLVEPGGFKSSFALAAHFELSDPRDNVRQLGGIELFTKATADPVNLTGFRQFAFSIILDSGTPPLPAGSQVIVELGCSKMKLDPYADQSVTGLGLDRDWFPPALQLDSFRQLNSSSNHACLQQVDSIRFQVLPGLDDGASTGGTLQIDDVRLLQ